MIAADLEEFLESGVTMLVGTRDAGLVAEATRGLGARVHPDGKHLTIFVSEPLAGRTLDNVRDNGRIAVCFTRPIDHRSIQMKGTATEVRPIRPGEGALIDTYRGQVARALAIVGIPARLTMRLAHRPAWAITLEVRELFSQTPGPGAGAALSSGAGDK